MTARERRCAQPGDVSAVITYGTREHEPALLGVARQAKKRPVKSDRLWTMFKRWALEPSRWAA